LTCLLRAGKIVGILYLLFEGGFLHKKAGQSDLSDRCLQKVNTNFSAPIVGMLLSGVLIRLAIIFVSDGSNDVRAWGRFASAVLDGGISKAYAMYPECNHPPLALWLSGVSLRISTATGIRFSIIFKIPSLLAETLTMVLLLKMSARLMPSRLGVWVLGAYTFTPLAILISAFHGNTDAICVSMTLLALYCIIMQRSAATGLSLAAAINIKLIPLLFAPLLALGCARKSGYSASALVKFLGACAVGVVPLVVAYSVSPHFSSQVLKYSSVPDRWGIIYLLLEIQRFEIGQQFFTDMKAAYRLNGRFIVPAITGLVGSMVLFVPVGSLRHLAAIIACLFVILASGWGIQYLLYPLPFLLLSSPVLGLGYALFGGIFATCLYGRFLTRSYPLVTFHNQKLIGLLGVFAILVWMYLLFCVVRIGYRCFVSERKLFSPTCPEDGGAID